MRIQQDFWEGGRKVKKNASEIYICGKFTYFHLLLRKGGEIKITIIINYFTGHNMYLKIYCKIYFDKKPFTVYTWC